MRILLWKRPETQPTFFCLALAMFSLFCLGDQLAFGQVGSEASSGARNSTSPSASLEASEKTRFEEAARYSHAANGTSVLVMRKGEVIFESYADGWNADRPHLLASGTKSFSGVMAACAAEDGILKLDELVCETLTEWKDDPRKSKITIRQLLSLSSGIEGGNNMTMPAYERAVGMANAVAEPGKKFSYGPIPYQCFGELMKRKLAKQNETVESYMRRRIIDPIGLNVAVWRKGLDGNINLPAGLLLTPREWVKFGELVRLGGKWGEKQIVATKFLDECFKPAPASQAYGMTWWLLGGGAAESSFADSEGPRGRITARIAQQLKARRQGLIPADTVAALGKGKNCCYVIRSQEMVIIRMGDSAAGEYNDLTFLSKVLGTENSAALSR
jgi:CubicO group peptidase (beta-lactamase class C family)